MNSETSGFKKTIGLWFPFFPFGFCLFLCGMVMFMLMKTGKIEPAYPAFFCFLPMTFLFMAVAMGQLRNETKQLSDRIEQLEKKRNANPTTALPYSSPAAGSESSEA